jgi:hypothetical protein
VEYAIICQAGSDTADAERTDAANQTCIMFSTCHSIVQQLSPDDFQDPDLQHDMLRILKLAKKELDGQHLFEKFKEIRSELRVISSKMQTNFSSMVSGMQLRDISNKWLVDQYCKVEVQPHIRIFVFTSYHASMYCDFKHVFAIILENRVMDYFLMERTIKRFTTQCLAYGD